MVKNGAEIRFGIDVGAKVKDVVKAEVVVEAKVIVEFRKHDLHRASVRVGARANVG